MTSDTEVIVFARTPVLGTVKTRLAASVGDSRALEVYQVLAAHVLHAICLADRTFTVTVAYTPDSDDSREGMASWLRSISCRPDRLQAQTAGDLGARMQAAIAAALARAHNAIVVGTDCPSVTAKTVEDTIEALRAHPCVLGPALDGGYYLIATTRADLPVFQQMQWSTENVFAQTLARLSAERIPVATLAPERDVDTIEDWDAISPRLGLKP